MWYRYHLRLILCINSIHKVYILSYRDGLFPACWYSYPKLSEPFWNIYDHPPRFTNDKTLSPIHVAVGTYSDKSNKNYPPKHIIQINITQSSKHIIQIHIIQSCYCTVVDTLTKTISRFFFSVASCPHCHVELTAYKLQLLLSDFIYKLVVP